MTELTWILDASTGTLTVEGLEPHDAVRVVGDLLPAPRAVNCARPLTSQRPRAVSAPDHPTLRVARLYHGSVVDGPGRRSVVQLQGCTHHCPGCYVPETHSPDGGVALAVAAVVAALLDPSGAPRDGITISGGEPLDQPTGLLALLEGLKQSGLHVVVYSGYTLEALARQPEPAIPRLLALTDLLVDSPFVAALAAGAGEWRGSRNQRLIPHPAVALATRAHRERTRLAGGG